jgi:NYN domain
MGRVAMMLVQSHRTRRIAVCLGEDMSNRQRWMLFVDGENFTIRGQALAEARGLTLPTGPYYIPDTFLWYPVFKAGRRTRFMNVKPHGLSGYAQRAYYYAVVQGGTESPDAVKETLWNLGFSPQVFHKQKSKRTKRVDITLATDVLSNAYLGNYDVAVLVAGDEDYIPLVEEVKRLGRVVTLAFFADPIAGLSNEMKLSADGFVSLDDPFFELWQDFLATGQMKIP